MAIDDKLVTLGDLKTVIDNTHDSTKQDTLTFDATPTQGSTNPVTSGGIYTGLDGKVDKENGKGLSTNDFTDADKQKLAELSQYVGAGVIFDTASGSMASFSDGGDDLPVKNVVVNVDPVQDTSGGPPSPTNICPITGHTSAMITRVGKNLLNDSIKDIGTFSGVTVSQNSNGEFVLNGTATANNVVRVGEVTLPAGSYSFSGITSTGSPNTYFLNLAPKYSGADNENLYSGEYSGTSTEKRTYTAKIYFRAGVTFNNMIFKPMIRFTSDTDSAFEPYQGQVYNIAFPGAAGTVYGGTLDLNAGRLTVDRAYTKVKNLTWSSQASTYGTFYASVPDAYQDNEVVSVMSDCYAGYNNGTGQEGKPEYVNGIYIGLSGAQPAVKVYDVQYPNTSDLENWKTARAECEIVYKLATQVTYSLTAEEIITLLGINHVWADTGDVSVEYAADPKLYINKVIANALNA